MIHAVGKPARYSIITFTSSTKNTLRVSNARNIALNVLMRVEKGAFAEKELDQSLGKRTVSAKDHALATELVYGVLRWKYRLDELINQHVTQPTKRMPPLLRQILRIGIYQYLFLSKVPPHAIANEAVNQALFSFDPKQASFVNAVLRAVLDQGPVIDAPSWDDAPILSRYYSHPPWLVERWLQEFGFQNTVQILASNNMPAPLMCRLNDLKTTLRELFASLEQEGMECKASVIPNAFQLYTHGHSLRQSPAYRKGLFSVQDIASQIIPQLLKAKPGMRVLDACAAPGGKTAHLASLCHNRVFIIAVDVSERRLAATRKNLQRLGVENVDCRAGDVMDKDFTSTLGKFDRILIDAPCSGLGVLRRNPEARYRVKEKDLPVFAAIQTQIVRSLIPLLEPGGKMVYSVCTVTHEETRGVVSAALADASNVYIDPIEARDCETQAMECFLTRDGYLKTFPSQPDMLVDGFFAARMIKDKKCE